MFPWPGGLVRPSGLVRFPSLDEGDWRMGDRWKIDVALLVKEVDAVLPDV